MADITELSVHDYSAGAPRQHHSLYLDDGNFVMQAENAIFKVHRFFLAKYSSVLKGMFDAPKTNDSSGEGTRESPVVFTGDSASGWELLLEDIYGRDPIMDSKEPTYNNEQLLLLLGIANKYCMEQIEAAILCRLRRDTSTTGYVDRIIASQMIDSKALYEEGLQGLIGSNAKPDLAQSKQIGTEPMHALLMAAYIKIEEAQANLAYFKAYSNKRRRSSFSSVDVVA